MLKAKNITLNYLDGTSSRTILSDLSFEIGAGESTFILGPSGSGKSSLLYILALLKKPTSGSIYFNDEELCFKNENTVKVRYDNFGFVFQNHFLIQHLNVLENVCMASYKGNIENKAKELLEELGLGDKLYQKPFKLSGGEKQRVAIARALVKSPKILFADEPTASLDHQNAMMIMDIFEKIKKDTTIICATHDIEVIPKNVRKLILHDGKLLEN